MKLSSLSEKLKPPLRNNGRHALEALLAGTLSVLVGSFAALWFSGQETGAPERIRNGAYQYLQEQLPWSEPTQIQIIDISDYPQENGATSRKNLETILANLIADKDQLPLAVGFDIDFSPDGDHLVPGDPEFFEKCLNARNENVKVFLGVHRRLGGNPQLALGFPRFQNLAAALLVHYDARYFVTQLGTEDSEGMRSMVTMLASVLQAEKRNPESRSNRPIPYFACKVISKDKSASVRRSLIYHGRHGKQFDPRRQFNVIHPKGDLSFRDEDYKAIKNSVVLIGDVDRPAAADLFPDPLSNGSTIPGVVLQALGVYSSAIGPLCEVTDDRDLFIDLFLGFTGVCVQVATILTLGTGCRSELILNRLEKLVAVGLASLVILTGALVSVDYVFWPGFIFVALALLVDPYVVEIPKMAIPYLKKCL